jgi:Fe-S-cluster-containing dehydrogenase component
MTRYGMAIDVKKCVGCYNCFLTCRDEFAGNEYPGYAAAQPMSGMNWTRLIELERGQYPHVRVNYIPVQCNHCDDCNAMKFAEDGAMYRRPDGIIMIDPDKAKGQKQLLNGCPYRSIEWNEEKQLPQKCNMCAHLLDAGEPEPRCVESCPSGARIFGDLDDPSSEIAKLVAAGANEARYSEFGLKEKVTYRNLPKKFVAGTVILGDVDEVAIGADVTVSVDGKSWTAKTNGFGDFEIEGLPTNATCSVQVAAAGYKPATRETKTSKDVYLGEIVLSK